MKRNFLQRIWGKICWWVKWKLLEFPEYVKDYGVLYALNKVFIRGWWYDLRHGIGNLISYFGLIWTDRDWDSHFWVLMNIKKLKRMEDLIRNHGCHLYHVRDADNIRLARLALERIRDDNYFENAFINHDKKWGKNKISFIPVENSNCSQMVSERENVKTERDEHYEKKASRRLFKHGDYMKKQDLEFATKIINKYLFHWWD